MALKKCVCHNSFQDYTYGGGMRVANPCKNKTYRCTSCGKDIVASKPAKVKTVEESKK